MDIEELGWAKGLDEQYDELRFYGGRLGGVAVAVVQVYGRNSEVVEVFREHAVDADDARQKLTAWAQSTGWRVLSDAERHADVRARALPGQQDPRDPRS
jgi:hypothetical protein